MTDAVKRDGPPVSGEAAKKPEKITMNGAYVTIEPLDPARHSDALWKGAGGAENGELWRYMHSGPFESRESFDTYLAAKAASDDPLYFTLIDRATGEPGGHATYMRIDTNQRVIEVGSIVYLQAFQRTRAATEAMYLMAKHAFEDLGFRRYEWKCNVLNEASQRAARRLGFSFEGVFRQHMIVKGRSRDTAWYAMLDYEWPARRKEFERWLAPDNFDEQGRQKTRLRHE
ncbi:MAG TPA: GNAT family protein [Bryobacteraceae bacterium]|nr:GNAT family protein [Bryobacteraceae bacterium]